MGKKKTENGNGSGKSNRGFAAMDPEKRAKICSSGGTAAHAQGRAHEFTSEEARVAGKRGGEIVSRDREHMAAIGKLGGESRARRKREREKEQRS